MVLEKNQKRQKIQLAAFDVVDIFGESLKFMKNLNKKFAIENMYNVLGSYEVIVKLNSPEDKANLYKFLKEEEYLSDQEEFRTVVNFLDKPIKFA